MNISSDLQWVRAAGGFDALSAPPRLKVLRALVRHGNKGFSVGELRAKTGIAASTLAHHLSALSRAEIIIQEKSGRETINRANFDRLQDLANFIMNECCIEEHENNGES